MQTHNFCVWRSGFTFAFAFDPRIWFCYIRIIFLSFFILLLCALTNYIKITKKNTVV